MSAIATTLKSDLSIRQELGVPADSSSRDELFRFRFGSEAAASDKANIFHLHVEPISGPVPDEIWYTGERVTTERFGEFAVAASESYFVIHVEIDMTGANSIDDLTTDLYREILQLARDHGYPNLLRAWNYFPGINRGEGDLERYRQFTAGRARAFEEYAFAGKSLPAGTAIGTDDGTPLTVSVLATRDACRMIENPRQTSAYDYPREYGPSSPSFSRAVLVSSASDHRILVSGTASIVGHESLYRGDPAQQAMETLRNLDELIAQARRETDTMRTSGHPLTDGYWRVYVRRSSDLPDIESIIRKQSAENSNLLFLRGDICRSELLLEIETAGAI